MIALDTNVVVRLLVADDADQASRARRLVANNDVLLTTTVLLECEWVLRHAYGLKPEAIYSGFMKLMGLSQLRVAEPNVIQEALDYFRQGIDLADALHVAASRSADRFATFDKALRRCGNAIIALELIEP